jgi:protein phosphatase
MSTAVFGAASDVGWVRELNEDCVLAQPPVFVVADGMGGHAAGEVAADLAMQQFAALAGREDLKPEDVVDAVAGANAAILARSSERSETAGMGTTLSGVCLGVVGGSPHWFVFNVGDSRVYRFADGALRQITVDHSEVEELLAAGRITREEARVHPLRNVVTRSLGMDPAPVPDIWVLPVGSGDRFLICSDGLPLEVTETEIVEVLSRAAPPQTTAEMLVRMAVDAGGRDNVSVVVVETPRSETVPDADVSTAPRQGLAGGQG